MKKKTLLLFLTQLLFYGLSYSLFYGSMGCSNNAQVTSEESPADIVLETKDFASECADGSAHEVNTDGADSTVTDSDQTLLDCQLHYSNADLGLVADEGSSSQSALTATSTSNIILKLVATVDAPIVNGNPLGASDVFFNGNQAIVTYNTAGEVYQGAVQVVDISEATRPRLLSQTVFKNVDVSTGIMDGSSLYLAEGESVDVTGESSPAQIQKIVLTAGLIPDVFEDPVPLTSYVGTDVIRSGDFIYVVTGNTGGLAKLNASTLAPVDFLSLDDARSLALDTQNVILYVFQGTPGRITAVHLNDFSATGFSVGGATIPESKSTAQFYQNLLFLGAGDGGALIVDPISQQILATLTNPNRSDLSSDVQVTNAVTVQDNLLFVSNGEAGIRAASWAQSGNAASAQVIGTLDFPSHVSANGIAYRGDFLMIASGTSGLKIVKIIKSPYLQNISCSNITSVFCEDFAKADGSTINDDVRWRGSEPLPQISATTIGQGGRIEANRSIKTLSTFEHTATGKQYSIKFLKSGKFSVLSSKDQTFGIEASYDGISSVQTYVGSLNGSGTRFSILFKFPINQSAIVFHVYQNGSRVKLAVELSDGSMSLTNELSVTDSRESDKMQIKLAPFDTSTQPLTAPSFDNVLVENYTF